MGLLFSVCGIARFRALAEVPAPATNAPPLSPSTDGAALVPTVLLELVAADPNADMVFAGWEKLRTTGIAGVDLAVHKALAVVVSWAAVAEPLAQLGAQVATKTIKTCLRSLYRGLSARSHSQVKATLGFCTAIVGLGPSTTREFCLAFDFTIKALSTMGVGRRGSKHKGKVPPDRVGFAKLMLQMLAHGDESVLQKVAITHQLVGTLFVGIENDTPELQKSILETVRHTVLRSGMMRKSKLGVLRVKALLQLGKLYRCDSALPGG